MRKIGLRYGLYAAITGFIAFGLSLLIGASEVLGYTAILIALSFVFFGIKYYRDTENNGKLRFKKALVLGILITIITAAGVAIMDGLYVTVFDPDFYINYGQEAIDKVAATGDEAALAKTKKEFEYYNSMTPIQLGLFSGGFMFVLVTVIGMIISIISGLILKKE